MYLNCPLIFRKDINFVTNNYLPETEGFGFQYSNIINSMLFAEVIEKPFHYTPFQGIAHNYGKDPEFLNKKEKLINLIDHFPINRDISIQKSQFIGIPNSYFPGSKTEQTVKSLFFAEKNKEKYFSNDSMSVAIHIRKKNAHDYDSTRSFLDNIAFYRQFLDFLRLRHTKSTRYHIYSQGEIESFCALQSEDVSLHINESIEDTFCAMAFADVLFTAYSCLSYTAGFLSNGPVYYFLMPDRIYSPHSFPDGSSEIFPTPSISPMPNWHPITTSRPMQELLRIPTKKSE
jgi:hypothetical protein